MIKWAWILGFLIGMLIFSRCESFNAYISSQDYQNHKLERQKDNRADIKNKKGKKVRNNKHKSIKKEVKKNEL
jgi:hypothetical protein